MNRKERQEFLTECKFPTASSDGKVVEAAQAYLVRDKGWWAAATVRLDKKSCRFWAAIAEGRLSFKREGEGVK